MEFSGVDLYLLMIFPIIYVEAGLNLEKDNVCLKSITYNETIKVTIHKPASKRETIICLKEGKSSNCNEEITIDVKEPRIITRTKIVPTCCEGYEENMEGTQCVPVCPNGCGSGKCIAPKKCSCEAGFFGSECDQICDIGRWGENCINVCNCSENELCDKISGCICKPGWLGDRCATPCPQGYYGFLCQEECHCDDNFCDGISGTCIKSREDPSVGTEIGIKQEAEINPSNTSVDANQTVLKPTDAKDFKLPEPKASTNASQNGTPVREVTATIRGTDEAGEVQEREKSKPEQTENSTPVYETKFKPVQDLEERVQHAEAPTSLKSPENTKKIDILKELTNLTVREEKILNENELFHPASDSHTVQSVKSSRVSNFIPTFTVLSGFTVLILLIAGKWLIITLRKKVKKIAKVELGCSDEELGILDDEKLAWENNLDNPGYVTDILKSTPTILQTFKPVAAETENKSTEKKSINLVAD